MQSLQWGGTIIIKRDYKNQFVFASLQSEEGKRILHERNLSLDEMHSFILIENGKIFDRSTAALKVAAKLKGFWSLFYVFIIVPKFIRDSVYNLIARNRYEWFGRKNECMIPSPELKSKFLN